MHKLDLLAQKIDHIFSFIECRHNCLEQTGFFLYPDTTRYNLLDKVIATVI